MRGREPGPQPERPRRRRPWWRRGPFPRLLVFASPLLLSITLGLLRRTLRTEFVGERELFERWGRGEQIIVSFWHNRLLMMPIAAAGFPICIMVSQHRDGEIATQAMQRWGIHTVRGSATRGAVPGFLRLVAAYRRGYSLAVVPDGPRGPRYVAKPGVIHLAKATGADVYPVTYASSRAWRLRSWDQLIVPRPFARVTIEVGEPLRVPSGADGAVLESLRQALETRLNELTRAAEARYAP